MTWVDLVVLGVLALSGLLACIRGLVREVLSVVAWIGAGAIATAGQDWAGSVATQWIPDAQIASVGSFVTLLLVSLVILKMVAKAIGTIVKSSPLASVDGTLGLVFGLARGSMLVIAAYILGEMMTAIDRWPEPVQDALFMCPTYKGAKWILTQQIVPIPESHIPKLYEQQPHGSCDVPVSALLQRTPRGHATGN